jgi:hypothetical protein
MRATLSVFVLLSAVLLAGAANAADPFYERVGRIAKDVQALPAGAKPATATADAAALEAKAKSCKANDLPCERETRKLATQLGMSLQADANTAKMLKETARLEKIEKLRQALLKVLNA